MPIFGGDLTIGGITEIVLDPSEVATDRTELHLNYGPINVIPDGIDWGDAQIEQYLADAARGQVPVDFRVPNRIITIPLLVGAAGPASFQGARAQLQAKVALFQQEGGWLRRGVGRYADVIGATLKFPDHRGHLGVENEVVLTLEALPDFYGDEIELSTHTTTTADELVFTEADIEGDYPGRVTLRVEENDGDLQRGLIAAFRSRRYSADPTDRLAYEAEVLIPLDTAAVATRSGASGGGSNNVVKHSSVGGTWTPILSTQIAASGHMTHKGTYKVYARVFTDSTNPPLLRLVYDVGDLVNPEENTPVRIPGTGAFYILPFGDIRLDPVPTGTHRWQGIIQGKGDEGGDPVEIDKVWIVPADEWFAELTAPVVGDPGLATYVARDEFNQTAGSLAGKGLPVGSLTWAGVTGSDSDDFAVVAAPFRQAWRSSDSDGAPRLESVSGLANQAAVALQVDVAASTSEPLATGSGEMGMYARDVDIDNYVAAFIRLDSDDTGAHLIVRQLVGGTPTDLGSAPISYARFTSYTVRLLVAADGVWFAWAGPAGVSLGEPMLQGRSPDLAAGGALEDGEIGLYDWWLNAGSGVDRRYDNFAAWVPALDAVMHPNRSIQLCTDGVYREDAAGAASGRVTYMLRGGLPRLPVAGMEGRTLEVFLKASRGDFAGLPDMGIDDVGATLSYRPCWLFPSD